jgi:hypothetical protein
MRVEVGSDHIVHTFFLRDKVVCIDDVKMLYDKFKEELSLDTPYCFIFSDDNHSGGLLKGSFDSSIKKHAAGLKRVCVAIVARNLVQRMTANFVIKMSQLETPVKIVANIAEARAYCQDMKEKTTST